MVRDLIELDARLLPSAPPFPDAPGIPYTVAYLRDGGLIAAAGDGGGPRVVRQDAAGNETWSVYVADPDTRQGVPAESFRLLLAAGADVLQVAGVTPAPADLDPAANGVTSHYGLADEFTRLGVGLVFREPPASLSDRLWLPQDVYTILDDDTVYVAVGDDVAVARTLPRYVEIVADGLTPAQIVAHAADWGTD